MRRAIASHQQIAELLSLSATAGQSRKFSKILEKLSSN